jgi:hypothetical protein
MADEKMVSEKDAVLRERAAFRAGVDALFISNAVPAGMQSNRAVACAQASAEDLYPLPKVTRPRVVQIRGAYSTYEYRWVDNHLELRSVDGAGLWQRAGTIGASDPAFLVALGQLAAAPTEEVDA